MYRKILDSCLQGDFLDMLEGVEGGIIENQCIPHIRESHFFREPGKTDGYDYQNSN